MQITYSKEITISDPQINIAIDLKNNKADIILRYTCPDCCGHGCRHSGRQSCNSGSISEKLDPDKIDRMLDAESASKLKSIIRNLLSPTNIDYENQRR